MMVSQLSDIIPSDFDPNSYLLLNPDLVKDGVDTPQKAREHYLLFGRKENRSYEPSVDKNIHRQDHKLPKAYKDFDPKIYKMIHSDIAPMTDEAALTHFINHGITENRIYKTNFSYKKILEIIDKQHKLLEKIEDTESPIVFINHDSSLTGAPIVLKNLYNYSLKHSYLKNLYFIDAYPNEKFYLGSKRRWLYHFNDTNELSNILQKLNPVLIISNSINIYLQNINNIYNKYLYKTIFYLHEYYSDFKFFMKDAIPLELQQAKFYLVSQNILKEFQDNGFNNTELLPPFFNLSQYHTIQKYQKQKNIKNKICTIGMCGSICDRKNFELFYFLAQNMKDKHFIWIGGKLPHDKKPLSNLTNIDKVTNPYKYLKNIDYFLLTSKRDPCPVVVLEALGLNKKIIVLDKNISYEHPDKQLENYITIKNHYNDNQIILHKLQNLKLNTEKNATNKNIQYIENHFLSPAIFNLDNKISKHVIGLSYYCHNNFKLSDYDHYINLINQSILRFRYSPRVILSVHSDKQEHKLATVKYWENHCFVKPVILFRENRGYDMGGLMQIIDHIHQNKVDENEHLIYLHNKSNRIWTEELHKIMYLDSFDKYDTVVSKKFTVKCKLNDCNRIILAKHDFMRDISDIPFAYTSGTTFITKIKNLYNLYINYNYIQKHFTTIKTNDIFWQSYMNDEDQFNNILHGINACSWVSPIDIDSRTTYLKYKCKNYMELFLKYHKRGIPDLQFEHALERYIGYLILNNKNTKQI